MPTLRTVENTKGRYTVDLAQQRAVELRHQKQALQDELVEWRGRTNKGQKLQKHFTQVLAITAKLDGFLAEIQEPDPQAADPFAAYAQIHRMLLGGHRIWAYFRSKLALRDVDWLADDLKCADELAWECYRPAREKAAAAGAIAPSALKEPPLVFFSNDASPFVQARNTIFEPEQIDDGGALGDLGAAILMLPISVIGIPWFQLHHLPMAVVVAHEVGHAVEHDFGLEKALEAAFAALAVPDARKPAWSAWRDELFADAYGVLCCGQAYVQALMDFLLGDPAAIQKERKAAPNWGRYPGSYLRMFVNFRLLAQLGVASPGLEKAWQDTYQFHLLQPYEGDVPAVVAALLDTPYDAFGGATIKDVVAFGQADVAAAQTAAKFINQGLSLPVGTSFRCLYAATTLAYYTDPETYARRNAHSAVVKKMLASIPPGVRSAVKAPPAAQAAAITDLYSPTGVELFDFLAGRSIPIHTPQEGD